MQSWKPVSVCSLSADVCVCVRGQRGASTVSAECGVGVAECAGGAGGGASRGSVRMISEGVSTRMCASASRSPPAVTVTLGARTGAPAGPGGGTAGDCGGAGCGGGGGGGAGEALGGGPAGERPPSSAPPELCRANSGLISWSGSIFRAADCRVLNAGSARTLPPWRPRLQSAERKIGLSVHFNR